MREFIYIIRPVGKKGPVKIGWSSMPQERLTQYMRWSPVELEIVATIAGSSWLEQNLHECLSRSHSHGEWFKPTKEVVSFVENIMAGVPVHEAIDLAKRHGRIRIWRGPYKAKEAALETAQ